MRYVSEIFKEKQNQIIRPPMKLYFEVDSDVEKVVTVSGESNLSLDESVAPVIQPKMCDNERYYAILGDGKGVDDPNRICAPDNTDEIAAPDISVPWGVTPFTNSGSEAIIGVPDTYYDNFIGIGSPLTITLSFKGGLIPEYINVYEYSEGSWEWLEGIDNSDLNEEVEYTSTGTPSAWKYFTLYNSDTDGRYQLNWVKRNNRNGDPIIFKNNSISLASINEETDLTSQTLPDYKMTVTCLDVKGEYDSDSDVWKRKFIPGAPCLFKCGFEVGGETEYLPLFYGNLTQQPSYSNGKITFNVAIDWRISTDEAFLSRIDSELDTGDIVDNRTFKSFLDTGLFFDSYDVFHGADDMYGSECNYYGFVDRNDTRQLMANAMGCFITVGINTFILNNTNDVQYKIFNDYLTRYEQSKNDLIPQPKVGKINITRNEYTLSDRTFEAEAIHPLEISNSSMIVYPQFQIPVWAFGKAEIIDAQSSVPTANVLIVDYVGSQHIDSEGLVFANIGFKSDIPTTIKPIVRFYEVDKTEYSEIDVEDSKLKETYYNDNFLIANGYNAGKAKRVALFVSETPYVYEVDVIQDFTREVGDVIRLETKKGIFKTCIITGLKFTFPGSKGHVTCRKIFALEDSDFAVQDIINAIIMVAEDSSKYTYMVLESDINACIVGKMTFDLGVPEEMYFVVGASSIEQSREGESPSIYNSRVEITDDNNHIWNVFYMSAATTTPTTPVIDMGTVTSITPLEDQAAYGAITLIMKIYEEQGITSPVNYENTYDIYS